MKNRLLSAAMCGAVVVACPAWAADLNPPPGPIVAAMKTLNEVQPRIAVNTLPGNATAVHVISEAGSYYLTGTVLGQAGKNGIRIEPITPGDVSIDLNGYELRGTAGSLNGIATGSSGTGCACFRASNGTIDLWGGHGASFDGEGDVNISDVMIGENSGDGLHRGADRTLNARDLLVMDNAGDGLEIAGRGVLRDSLLIDNAAAVRVAAGARGVVLRDVNISGSGAALLDSGTGTILRAVDVNADGVNAASLITLGSRAKIDGLTVNVTDSTFSGPAVVLDGTSSGVLIHADSILAALMCQFKEWSGNDGVVAEDSTFSTAIVQVDADGSFRGSVTARGTTSAPSVVRLAGNNVNLSNCEGRGVLRLNANTPIGIEVVGASNTIQCVNIKNVPAGGTGIKISGGGGNEVRSVSIAGSGAGAYTAVQLLSNNNLVANNVFTRLAGGTAVDNQGDATNGVGPTVTPANIAGATNPFANLTH